jgi:copper chaperone CopZ
LKLRNFSVFWDAGAEGAAAFTWQTATLTGLASLLPPFRSPTPGAAFFPSALAIDNAHDGAPAGGFWVYGAHVPDLKTDNCAAKIKGHLQQKFHGLVSEVEVHAELKQVIIRVHQGKENDMGKELVEAAIKESGYTADHVSKTVMFKPDHSEL